MLGIVIAFFPGIDEAADETAKEATEEATIAVTPSEVEDYTGLVTEPSVEEALPEMAVEIKPAGKLYIVIDDVGNSISELEGFLQIKVPVTFAVIPGLAFSKESAELIESAGFDIILHQPMEPVGNLNPGEGAITTDMDREEVFRVLEDNLEAFPSVKGINNHMGSRVTADRRTMTSVMSFLNEKDMFFLDSVTTNESVAEEVAEALGVPFAKRNSVFLDNEHDKPLVEKALKKGTEVASLKGSAIMIGHVKTRTLVEIINEMSTELVEKGYTFHGLSSLFEEDGS